MLNLEFKIDALCLRASFRLLPWEAPNFQKFWQFKKIKNKLMPNYPTHTIYHPDGWMMSVKGSVSFIHYVMMSCLFFIGSVRPSG